MVGKNIFDYELKKEIGAGSFGTVYLAEKNTSAGKEIRAVKHIRIPYSKEQYEDIRNSIGGDTNKMRTYIEEAAAEVTREIANIRSISETDSKNVVRYYEHHEEISKDGTERNIYMFMEYLTPFSKYRNSSDLTVKDIICLGKDILSALKVCHAMGIIHRDIKEDNIFVLKNVFGETIYKLGDFGVSKKLSNKKTTESFKGTPRYLAPEVYKSTIAGHTSYTQTVDIYSLGIVLYRQLHTGRDPYLPPYPKEYNNDMLQEAQDKRLYGNMPIDSPYFAKNVLGDVIQKALLPADLRYQSAQEFLDALIEAEKKLSPHELEICVNKDRNHLYDEENEEENIVKTINQNEDTITNSEELIHADPYLGTVSAIDKAEVDVGINLGEDCCKFDSDRNPKVDLDVKKQDDPVEKKSGDIFTINIRKLLIFGMPPVLLLLYIGFYMLMIPALYGKTLSFFDWIFADVNNIVAVLRDVNNILVPAYIIILLVILQYVLLGAFLLSIFFACKELHGHDLKAVSNVKYTGRTPCDMLSNILLVLKSNNVISDKTVLNDLKLIIETMKYSKEFAIANSTGVVQLENEICQIIDILSVYSSSISISDEGVLEIKKNISLLKQKNTMRDEMLKK